MDVDANGEREETAKGEVIEDGARGMEVVLRVSVEQASAHSE